jgi:hypothetical protein
MIGDLDVLRIVSERLDAARIPYMLTGSYALAFYTTPRMTRDLDLVVSLDKDDTDAIVKIFEADFYVDADDVRTAVLSQRQFNLMHLKSGIKVDLIIRKSQEYRQVEFARRREATLAGVKTWIVTREDLILSKLVWSENSCSELQQRDVRSLMDDSVDRVYVEQWAKRLGVDALLKRIDDE